MVLNTAREGGQGAAGQQIGVVPVTFARIVSIQRIVALTGISTVGAKVGIEELVERSHAIIERIVLVGRTSGNIYVVIVGGSVTIVACIGVVGKEEEVRL